MVIDSWSDVDEHHLIWNKIKTMNIVGKQWYRMMLRFYFDVAQHKTLVDLCFVDWISAGCQSDLQGGPVPEHQVRARRESQEGGHHSLSFQEEVPKGEVRGLGS